MILLKPGIESVEPSFVTGKMLIKYTEEKTTEKQIVAWAKKLFDNLSSKIAKVEDSKLNFATIQEILNNTKNDLENTI